MGEITKKEIDDFLKEHDKHCSFCKGYLKMMEYNRKQRKKSEAEKEAGKK